ncbi:hypothetical protein HN51_046442 [Arachis hypogaea]
MNNVQLNDDVLGLIVFKSDLHDPSSSLASWKDDSSACSWNRVQYNPAIGRVTEINLAGLELSGRIGKGLEKLQHLMVLSLSDNNFNGSITHSLTLSSTIQNLNLSHNGFSGQIPTLFLNMSSIRSLDLSHNSFSGHIPQSLGNWIFPAMPYQDAEAVEKREFDGKKAKIVVTSKVEKVIQTCECCMSQASTSTMSNFGILLSAMPYPAVSSQLLNIKVPEAYYTYYTGIEEREAHLKARFIIVGEEQMINDSASGTFDGIIFTVRATLRIMSEPVRMIPETLSILIQVVVSFNRLNTFLLAEELGSNEIVRSVKQSSVGDNNVVEIEGGNFTWDSRLPAEVIP